MENVIRRGEGRRKRPQRAASSSVLPRPLQELLDHDQERAHRVWNDLMPKQEKKKTEAETGDSEAALCAAQTSEPVHVMRWYKDSPNLVTPAMRDLLEDTAQLFVEHGHACDSTRWYIETWQYRLHRSSQPGSVSPVLGWHEDDGTENGFPEEHVLVALYYLKKDINVVGGNLHYIARRGHAAAPTEICTIGVRGGVTILMRGDVKHCPEEMAGHGERDLLIVQMKRVESRNTGDAEMM